jgi:hypothetical protein
LSMGNLSRGRKMSLNEKSTDVQYAYINGRLVGYTLGMLTGVTISFCVFIAWLFIQAATST